MFFFESFLSGIDTHAKASAWTLGFTLLTAPVAAFGASACDVQGALAEGEPTYGHAPRKGEAHCFELTVAEPGWALVSIEGDAPGHLEVVGLGGVEARELQGSAEGLLLAVEAGTYRVRVAPEDSRQRLGHYRAQAAFRSAFEAQGLDLPAALNEEEEEDDSIIVVIDPFAPPCGEALIEEEEDDSIIVVIDPFAPSCSGNGEGTVRERVAVEVVGALCADLTADDHGNTFLCAGTAFLDQTAVGDLWDDGGRDLFSVKLTKRTAVLFEASAERGNVELTLYDAHGQAMDRSDDRLERSLVAGDYFVGIRSRSTGGAVDNPYQLVVQRR